jgi:hypothetical protein
MKILLFDPESQTFKFFFAQKLKRIDLNRNFSAITPQKLI